MKLLTFSISFLACLAVIACDYEGITNERIFSLDNEQESNTFQAGIEDEFFIKMKGNPTTGYSWFLAETSNKDDLVALNLNDVNSSKNYESSPNPAKLLGSGGVYYFKFKGVKEGNYSLMFVKKRIWEQNSIDEKFVHLNIKGRN